jgi:hypothetical protein
MITNKHNIGLSLAVMLCSDDYDHDSRPNAISTTTLLQPLRTLALKSIYKEVLVTDIDVTQLVASSTGSAVHNQLENVWLNSVKVSQGLYNLGYKNHSVLVNPTEEDIKDNPNTTLVYVERRSEMAVGKYMLTGKYDIVMAGKLEDLKNTGSFKVIKTLKEEGKYLELFNQINSKNSLQMLYSIREHCPSMFDYAMQGSIYALLNPDIITKPYMSVQFIIKDWMKFKVGQDFYPEINPYQLDIDLFSKESTLGWVKDVMHNLEDILTTGSLPLCNDAELWRDPPQFKVYKDIKSKRALPKGTFDNISSAQNFNDARKVTGDIRLIPSVPRRCTYCNVREVCTQYDEFIETGLLKPVD